LRGGRFVIPHQAHGDGRTVEASAGQQMDIAGHVRPVTHELFHRF
jgi:hypothetical protein